MLKSSARIGAWLAQRARADLAVRRRRMDSCYLPFHFGNAGIEHLGGTIDRGNRPTIVRPNGSIFLARRGRALREGKFDR